METFSEINSSGQLPLTLSWSMIVLSQLCGLPRGGEQKNPGKQHWRRNKLRSFQYTMIYYNKDLESICTTIFNCKCFSRGTTSGVISVSLFLKLIFLYFYKPFSLCSDSQTQPTFGCRLLKLFHSLFIQIANTTVHKHDCKVNPRPSDHFQEARTSACHGDHSFSLPPVEATGVVALGGPYCFSYCHCSWAWEVVVKEKCYIVCLSWQCSKAAFNMI